jgi:ATP-dependent RNA helicase RhlE
MLFSSLGLSEPILRAVAEQGYTRPTPIQAQAIPAVLAGGDLLAGAQTGTGKTAGFTLPILQRLSASPAPAAGRRLPRALVLVPTRELAAQVEESVRVYGKYLSLRSTVIFGGVGMQPQIDALKRGCDIVVATPGRLLDLHQQRALDLSRIEVLVLDEADRMLDMGFIHDIKKVLALLPQHIGGQPRQNLLFSATFSDDIKSLADRLLNKPALIEVERPNTAAVTVTHCVHPVDRERKAELLVHLIRSQNLFQVLVFTRMKHGANRLAEQLNAAGIGAMAIHGNKSQSARTRALAEFKAGTLQVLVATDIAARGIDIDQLPQVVNYDLPNVPEDYVHRIGRTGRAGASGQALSLVTVDETQFLADIERLIGQSIPKRIVPGFEPDPFAVPQPIKIGRQTLMGAAGARRPHPGRESARHASPSSRGHGSRPHASPSSGRPAQAGAAPNGRTAGHQPGRVDQQRQPGANGARGGAHGGSGQRAGAAGAATAGAPRRPRTGA